MEAFASIVGEEECEPSKIYIAATVDQGGNIVNAFKLLGVDVLVCSAHRLNSAVCWATGTNGSFTPDGGGTCKNRPCRNLVSKVTAMVGHMSHSPTNNDIFKKVQDGITELLNCLEMVRRNDTR